MARFLETLHAGRVLLMDGAMGTELLRAGLGQGECGELWNISHPERIRRIHEAYVQAGAECLLTNTFQCNPKALARHGQADLLETINGAAVELARSAAGPDRFVLGDIGPSEAGWNRQTLARIVCSLQGVDAILLETFSDVNALWLARYACLPAIGSAEIPVLVSITYKKDEEGTITTAAGQPPEVFGQLARQYNVAALGVNCGREIDMTDTIEIIRRYRTVTDLPLFARPNAGTPIASRDNLVYPRTPDQLAASVDDLLQAGLGMLGGCCGTTPDHIRAFKPRVDSWNTRPVVVDCGL
jgi:5-methyltetrahydrofolate--homocysteine methyltransferase